MAALSMFYDPEATTQPDQYAAEFSALLAIYRERKPARVLEIGTRHGGTFMQWVKHAAPKAMIMGVDLPDGQWNESGPIDYKAIWRLASARNICIMSLIGDSHHHASIRAVMAILPEIDFLFIDGDHSEHGSYLDYVTYGALVRPGGVIALHDIVYDASHPDIEVHKVWRSICDSQYQIEELTSAEGQTNRGIGVVYT